MTTFALVHGAWHGAWCWDLLIPELEQRGHRAVAMDLPAEDPTAGCARYAEVVVDALDGDDNVVLVGHSLGGLTIPLVATARPVRRLVYLCALLPEPGRSFREQADRGPIVTEGLGANQIAHDDGSSSWPEDAAIDVFFHDCEPDLARWAARQLRPQAWEPVNETTPLETWPEVECAYILGRDERAVRPEWSRRAARERLGVDAIELPGGHSPFLARPAALADLLTSNA